MESDSLSKFFQTLSVEFIPFIIAVVFHEFSHGFVAHLWGDDTAKERGRMTLNPIPHIDPIGTVVLPILTMMIGVGFAWAKPVPIDPRRFRRFRPALFCVSMAGITMNILLAMLGAAAFCSMMRWMPDTFYLQEPLKRMAIALVKWNWMLAIFNLLPLPPLDGSKVLESFLPYKALTKFEALTRYSLPLFLLLWASGALNYLAYPITYASEHTLNLMIHLFRLTEILS